MATVGFIKCTRCPTFTNIPIGNAYLTCPGCGVRIAYIEANQNTLTIYGHETSELASELVIEPGIEHLRICNMPSLSHVEVKSGVLNVLNLERSQMTDEAGQCVITAHTIKELHICSNIALPNLTNMIENIKTSVLMPSWVRCKKLELTGKAVIAMDIPPEVEELIISQPDCPNEDEVIHHLMNVGPSCVALIRVGVETLRYSSRQVDLKLRKCVALREIIPPADDGLCKLHMHKCLLVRKLPVFAYLQSLHVSAAYRDTGGMDIRIPFMPSVRDICIRPFSYGLDDIYHFSEFRERSDAISLYDLRYEDMYMTEDQCQWLTKMHARVHTIERWWIEVALSPPCSGQPAGGVFYRKAMAAFMAARA